jgi:hypothetical protein
VLVSHVPAHTRQCEAVSGCVKVAKVEQAAAQTDVVLNPDKHTHTHTITDGRNATSLFRSRALQEVTDALTPRRYVWLTIGLHAARRLVIDTCLVVKQCISASVKSHICSVTPFNVYSNLSVILTLERILTKQSRIDIW